MDNLKKMKLLVVSTDESFFFFYDSLVRKVWCKIYLFSYSTKFSL